ERFLAPFQVSGVPADRDRHGGGHPDPRRVAPDDLFAHAAEVRVPLAEVEAERAVELVRVLRRQRGRPLGAGPADDDLRPGRPARDRRAVLQLVMLALEAEPLPRLGVPEAGEDRELLFEPVEPFAERRERDAEILVLPLVPGRADAELSPAATHLIDRG